MDPGTMEFVRRALALKDQMRRGWQRVGIRCESCGRGAAEGRERVQRPESVADHTWGVALLALVEAESRPELDRARLLELALTHDLAEAVVGDLVPGEYAHKGEKVARERRALEEMVETLPLALRGRLLARFEELASDATPEARLIHELDKLEMAFQAERYAAQGVGRDALADFHASAEKGVRDGQLAQALARLKK